ncbi:unnamed protein product [Polarella glacialis]|uniref:Uncharacterized protein n=1 Tax=Polarella glacialis TaxID=89957 RepID=A0A813DBS3_POLGL|nr:unnamed protein product [Polarella glacialis]CAE8583937.1 unnamed protein product [Polarella glacialis]
MAAGFLKVVHDDSKSLWRHTEGLDAPRRTFLQGQQPSVIYCEILKLFAMCPWWASCVMYSFRQEGRGSTASQRTEGELAPIHAAGKVPVPWAESVSGRPLGPSHGAGGEALSGATVPGLGLVAAAQACRERSMRSPTERGSLSPCPLFLWHSSFHNQCLGALFWGVVVIQTSDFHDTGCYDETNIFARPAAVNY